MFLIPEGFYRMGNKSPQTTRIQHKSWSITFYVTLPVSRKTVTYDIHNTATRFSHPFRRFLIQYPYKQDVNDTIVKKYYL